MTELKLDKWKSLYAKRTGSLKSSEIRNLFIVTSRPDIISFAGGMPDTRLFPMENFIKATRNVIKREGSAALQYGPSEGHEGLKKWIANFMAQDGMHVDEEDILITDGGQQALELIGKILIDPGDRIIVEAPCYIGAIQAFDSYQADMIPIPLDGYGMQTDTLAKTLAQLKKKGKKPKFLYTVPNFHNPAGVTLSLKRRKELLDLAKKHDLLVIEDNPYSVVRFEGKNIPSLKSMNNQVVYLSTFSKMLTPGLRLGWITAPKPIFEKLLFAKQAANLCSSPFTQRVVEEYVKNNDLEKQLKKFASIYRKRRDVMIEAAQKHFPKEAKLRVPKGGLFLWAILPEYIDTTNMLAEAVSEEKVAYVPGRAFFPDGSGKNCMRLNFSYPKPQKIREGIKRLSKVIRRQMALYRSMKEKLHLK